MVIDVICTGGVDQIEIESVIAKRERLNVEHRIVQYIRTSFTCAIDLKLFWGIAIDADTESDCPHQIHIQSDSRTYFGDLVQDIRRSEIKGIPVNGILMLQLSSV